MAVFHAEVPGQPAAAGDGLDRGTCGLQQPLVGVEAHDGVLMAMRLGQHRHPVQIDQRRLGCRCRRRFGAQQFGKCHSRRRDLPGPRVVRQQLDQVGAQHRRARRFQADDRPPGQQVRFQLVQGAPQLAAGDVELAGADPGDPAAHLPVGEQHPVAEVLQHRHRGLPDLRVEGVGEAVHPEHDLPCRRAVLRAVGRRRGSALPPPPERLRSKHGDHPPRVNPDGAHQQSAGRPHPAGSVDHSWDP